MDLYYYSKKSGHNSLIVSGFIMLKNQGRITLNLIDSVKNAENVPTDCICLAIINGSVKIAYDNADGYNFTAERLNRYLQEVDLYYKRSFSDDVNTKFSLKDNLRPLGMNFNCTVRKNPLDSSNFDDLVKRVGRALLTGHSSKPLLKYFECEPSYIPENKPKIVFSTRLWGSEQDRRSGISGAIDQDLSQNESVESINRMRIQLIRMAREEFGEQFWGGVYDSSVARRLAPDLILPRRETFRFNYIRRMHNSDICIASTGLSGSIGWKTAEYLASSKAIVSERLLYSVPGNFRTPDNYLEFSSAESCIAQLKELVLHPKRILVMQNNNYKYYNEFLRPDALVWKTISNYV